MNVFFVDDFTSSEDENVSLFLFLEREILAGLGLSLPFIRMNSIQDNDVCFFFSVERFLFLSSSSSSSSFEILST
tara:strand:+ start:687 stop:911 length:225 start_codon:yes stop_codon:yes gene_type:complete